MGINYSPKIVTNGLTICVDFANIKCYPKSGTIFNNLLSSSIGYLKNNVIYSEDFKGIVRTNGGGDSSSNNVVGDRIDINTTQGGIDRFKIDMNFTFSFWIRWINGSGKIFSTGSSGSGNTDNCVWQFWVSRNMWYWWNSSGGGVNNLQVSYDSLISNEWCLMSFVYSYNEGGNNFIRVYKNGDLIAVNSRSTSTHDARDRTEQSNLQYTLGGGYNSSCRNNNTVNDFGVFYCYNRALTPEEVMQNFNATKSRFGL